MPRPCFATQTLRGVARVSISLGLDCSSIPNSQFFQVPFNYLEFEISRQPSIKLSHIWRTVKDYSFVPFLIQTAMCACLGRRLVYRSAWIGLRCVNTASVVRGLEGGSLSDEYLEIEFKYTCTWSSLWQKHASLGYYQSLLGSEWPSSERSHESFGLVLTLFGTIDWRTQIYNMFG